MLRRIREIRSQLWFDVAQIRAVAENERKIRLALGKSFRMTFGNFGSIFWILLRIGVVALAVSAAALWFYVRVIPPEQAGLAIGAVCRGAGGAIVGGAIGLAFAAYLTK